MYVFLVQMLELSGPIHKLQRKLGVVNIAADAPDTAQQPYLLNEIDHSFCIHNTSFFFRSWVWAQ